MTITDQTTTRDADADEVAAFVDTVFTAALGGQLMQAAYLGDRLGWYRALDRADHPLTASELAEATGTDARYAREWLEHQATVGWLTVDDPTATPDQRRFELPAVHAAVLCDEESLDHLLPLARFVVGLGRHVDALEAAYRTGGGVSWAELGEDPREAQGAMNRPFFVHRYGPEHLPSIPDVDRLLRNGGRVADIGSGLGWSAVAVARQYPTATVHGYDIDEPSVERARRIAAEAGVADRVRFEAIDAAEIDLTEVGGTYHLVSALECIHDMPDPVGVLAEMRRLVADDGVVLVMDERVDDEFQAPGTALDQLFYGFSITCCLPDGMSHPHSAGTGTVFRPRTLERYASEAGYSSVEVLPIEDEMFRFYRLHP